VDTGTCHVGITAHFQTPEEAVAGGAKKYVPRDYDRSVDGLVGFFGHVINEIGLLDDASGDFPFELRKLVGRSGSAEADPREGDSIDLS
jgi:glutamate synthase (NADPH/NADH) large chain